MQYKKDKIDFIVDPTSAPSLLESSNYRLIHPNFDLYKDHIAVSMIQSDDITIVKYSRKEGSQKGAYTYDYFNLSELEIGSFDQSQGASHSEELNGAALEARMLAEDFGQ
ncbi:MAG: hypothetical protein EOP09_10010 [Proteobacteria bacterium]|nr:MAG: hypothetical protein EOP09_10010 [Pseudomonadota bacterium]